jgi:hypothetical protein
MASKSRRRRGLRPARLAGAAALGLSGVGLATGLGLTAFSAAAQASAQGTLSLASASLPSLPGPLANLLPTGLPSFPSLPGLGSLPSPSSLGSGAQALQSALAQGQQELQSGLAQGQQQLETLVNDLKSGQLPSGTQCLPFPAPPSLPGPLSGLGSFGLTDTAIGSANGQGVSLVVGLSSSKGLTLCITPPAAPSSSGTNPAAALEQAFQQGAAKLQNALETLANEAKSHLPSAPTPTTNSQGQTCYTFKAPASLPFGSGSGTISVGGGVNQETGGFTLSVGTSGGEFCYALPNLPSGTSLPSLPGLPGGGSSGTPSLPSLPTSGSFSIPGLPVSLPGGSSGSGGLSVSGFGGHLSVSLGTSGGSVSYQLPSAPSASSLPISPSTLTNGLSALKSALSGGPSELQGALGSLAGAAGSGNPLGSIPGL